MTWHFSPLLDSDINWTSLLLHSRYFYVQIVYSFLYLNNKVPMIDHVTSEILIINYHVQ